MKYILTDIPVDIHLGVEDEERSTLQEILISLSFSYDSKKASKSDDIHDTVDYFLVRKYIEQFDDGKSYHLLETLHAEMLEGLKETFPEMKDVQLSIEKFPFETGSVIVEN